MSLKSKREWILPEEKTEGVVKHILKLRGIENEGDFLNPKIENLPDHTHLYNGKKAAKRLIRAVKKGERIIIHG
ncbi:MAG TPA: hypothetical protein P5311_02225, partial [Candidatus Dojkabacteria bacterium]|nr:hypothetical protein [Candidatus Dojkabacteria bacterium]